MDIVEQDPFALERAGTLSDTDAAAAEVLEDAFIQAVIAVLMLAINGHPRLIRSTYAWRNEFLQEHAGDADSAAKAAAEAGDQAIVDLKEHLMKSLPYVGVPASVIYPLWRELRRACLIAAIYGHDLHQTDVQTRILAAAAGLAGSPHAETKLEKAAQKLWQRIAKASARKVKVGKAIAEMTALADRTGEQVLKEFRTGPGVPVEEYSTCLDK